VTDPIRSTRSPRREEWPAIIRWPIIGGLFAAGAIGVSRLIGPPVVRDLGVEAGAGFAEALAKVEEAKRALHISGRAPSGRWSGHRSTLVGRWTGRGDR